MGVGALQPVGRLTDVIAGQADRERPLLANELGEVGAVDEFKNEIIATVDFVRVERGDDVGMNDLGDRANLVQEQFHGAIGRQQLGGQHLERDDALHRQMLGLVNPAHAAAADLLEDSVLAQQEAGGSADEQTLGLKAREDTLID